MATLPKFVEEKHYGRDSVNTSWMRRWYYVEKPQVWPRPNHQFNYNKMWLTRDNAYVISPLSIGGIITEGTMGVTASTEARNKALTKLHSAFGEQALLAVNVAERKQAYDSLVNRSLQLIGAISALKKGNLKQFAKALGVSTKELEAARKGGQRKLGRRSKKRTKKEVANDVSGTWLEYHFGWEPMVHDIYNSIQTLQNPFDSKVVVVRADATEEAIDSDRSRINRWRVDRRSQYGWRLSALLTVDNPNLFRATQLGLVNPAAIAWELVPFSFVVDWFLPVGEFLNSYTNLFGVSVKDPLTTGIERSTYDYATVWTGSWFWADFGYAHVLCNRTIGDLPSYNLRLKTFKGFSVTRGATAIALLVQQLGHVSR